jgi:hypothetical protein
MATKNNTLHGKPFGVWRRPRQCSDQGVLGRGDTRIAPGLVRSRGARSLP